MVDGWEAFPVTRSIPATIRAKVFEADTRFVSPFNDAPYTAGGQHGEELPEAAADNARVLRLSYLPSSHLHARPARSKHVISHCRCSVGWWANTQTLGRHHQPSHLSRAHEVQFKSALDPERTNVALAVVPYWRSRASRSIGAGLVIQHARGGPDEVFTQVLKE